MDKWGKISETSLSENEDFYSHLNIEDITDADYAHTLLLADVFENFRNMYLEVYELNPAKCFQFQD